MMARAASRPVLWTLLLVNAVFLAVIFYLAPRTMMRVRIPVPASSVLPVLAEPAPFSLTRESGEAFSSEELKNRPWVADFIFTRCPNQCPAMGFKLAALQKTLPQPVRLVSFSVDPGHDTPAVLQTYAQRFGAQPERWIFLTGDAGTIRRIQSDLKLSNGEDPNLHSLRFVLMDAAGRARGTYDSEDAAALERLKKDLKRLETMQ